MTEFETSLSSEVFTQTYRYGDDKNILDAQTRVAKYLSSKETNPQFWEKRFKKILEDFKFVTGGRILSNAGTGLGGASMINCYVSGFEGQDRDSMSSIMDELKRQALILKSEGGYGVNIDTLRPRGAFIGGVGAQSPGAVRMLDMWDKQSETITRGSGKKSKRKDVKDKIRKGAQMVTMSCWHPDIEEFIGAKQEPGRLTKFNMSVLVTDEFMRAVKNHEPWHLQFPDYEAAGDEYKQHWDGNLKKWKSLKLPLRIYKSFDDANELWDIIMQSTYRRNEPGVLFVDRINRFNNLWYEEHINATNPCGEQLLPPGGVCLLGSLNITQFLIEQKGQYVGWDYDKLTEVIPTAVRMMDNVNDLTYVPLEIQKWNLQNKRRIGLGIMGLGSALMMRKIRYGSKKAIEETEKLISFIANTAYKASAILAKEKGPFPLYDEHAYMKSNFIKNLDPSTIEMIREHGIRNSHLLSIQPTGNTSTLANTVSGGLEPVFMHEYIRTTQQPYAVEDLTVPDIIDWSNKNYSYSTNGSVPSYTEWEWVSEGDTPMLRAYHNERVWKVDESRGLLKEELVEDYAVRRLKEKQDWEPNSNWAATTTDLKVQEHVGMMKVLAKYIDSAMSKTVNLPENYSYEDFKNLYMEMYNSRVIKGGTTYRAGTMATVLASKEKEDKPKGIQKYDATKRPKRLPCHIHKVRAEGGTWRVIIGLLEGDPYEVFAFKTHNVRLTDTQGILEKNGGGKYNLLHEDGTPIIKDIASELESDEQEALTRMISSSLRHGMQISFIVEQLQKAPGTVVSFNKALSRVLSRYANNVRTSVERLGDCQKDDCFVVHEEGCLKCLTCGESACQ